MTLPFLDKVYRYLKMGLSFENHPKNTQLNPCKHIFYEHNFNRTLVISKSLYSSEYYPYVHKSINLTFSGLKT